MGLRFNAGTFERRGRKDFAESAEKKYQKIQHIISETLDRIAGPNNQIAFNYFCISFLCTSRNLRSPSVQKISLPPFPLFIGDKK